MIQLGKQVDFSSLSANNGNRLLVEPNGMVAFGLGAAVRLKLRLFVFAAPKLSFSPLSV